MTFNDVLVIQFATHYLLSLRALRVYKR